MSLRQVWGGSPSARLVVATMTGIESGQKGKGHPIQRGTPALSDFPHPG